MWRDCTCQARPTPCFHWMLAHFVHCMFTLSIISCCRPQNQFVGCIKQLASFFRYHAFAYALTTGFHLHGWARLKTCNITRNSGWHDNSVARNNVLAYWQGFIWKYNSCVIIHVYFHLFLFNAHHHICIWRRIWFPISEHQGPLTIISISTEALKSWPICIFARQLNSPYLWLMNMVFWQEASCSQFRETKLTKSRQNWIISPTLIDVFAWHKTPRVRFSTDFDMSDIPFCPSS